MINKWVGAGNIVNDIEMKKTGKGTSVTNFRIAIKDRFTANKTHFLNVVAWDKTADFIAQYFSKGRKIIIEGRLSTRDYLVDDRKVYVTEIIAEQVDFGDSKGQGQNQSSSQNIDKNDGFVPIDEDEDELPF